MSDDELCEFESHVSYEGNLRAILSGDYSRINSKNAEILYNAFLIPVNEILGRPEIPENDKNGLIQKIRDEGFVSLGGPQLSEGDYLALYVFLEVLRQL